MRTLYLLRHIPGAGATTLAERFSNALNGTRHEADDCFMQNGKYVFNPACLKLAHSVCFSRVEQDMKEGRQNIFVSNTLPTDKEIEPYAVLAEAYVYDIVYIIVENRRRGIDIHNVPEPVKEKMRKRFSICL